MNNKVYVGIAFTIGAALGSVVSWAILKERYERRTQEEINSVKEVYSNAARERSSDKNSEVANEPAEEPDETSDEISEVEEEITRLGYRDYSSTVVKEKKKEVRKKMSSYEPSVITPEEFGENDDYEVSTLTYYADGTLTDDSDYPIEDIEGTIGYGSLSRFGEYADDAVYVRNDELKTDFEILYDTRNYSDVMEITSGQ